MLVAVTSSSTRAAECSKNKTPFFYFSPRTPKSPLTFFSANLHANASPMSRPEAPSAGRWFPRSAVVQPRPRASLAVLRAIEYSTQALRPGQPGSPGNHVHSGSERGACRLRGRPAVRRRKGMGARPLRCPPSVQLGPRSASYDRWCCCDALCSSSRRVPLRGRGERDHPLHGPAQRRFTACAAKRRPGESPTAQRVARPTAQRVARWATQPRAAWRRRRPWRRLGQPTTRQHAPTCQQAAHVRHLRLGAPRRSSGAATRCRPALQLEQGAEGV